MLGRKKKVQQSEAMPETQSESVKFEKNIKLLWIYTSLFCLFAVVLIAVSSFIQGKINSEAEYYQDKYHEATNSSQSALKNIQDENAALKTDLANAAARLTILENESETNKVLLNNSAEMLENAEHLINALVYEDDNEDELALAELEKIDATKLTSGMLEIYNVLKESLE